MTTLSLHLSKAAHEGTLHRQKNHTIHSVHFISVTDTIVKSARSPWHELNCRLMFQERCDVKFMKQMRRAAAWPAGRMTTSLVLRLKGIVNTTPSPPHALAPAATAAVDEAPSATARPPINRAHGAAAAQPTSLYLTHRNELERHRP